jgi:hypothetical protein
LAKPKLYLLFDKLTKKELIQLRKFLQSPYFTRRQDLFRLFEALAEDRQRERPHPEKKALYRKVFPGKAYRDLRLRATMSDLQEVIEQFLLIETRSMKSLETKMELTRLYRQRDIPKHFHHTFRESEKLLEEAPRRDAQYYQNRLELQTEWLQFALRSRRTAELNLQEIADTLDTTYIIRKLRHTCTQLSHQKVFQTEYDFGFLPSLLPALENSPLLAIPAVSVYYYCYRFLTEAYSLEHFQTFRRTLFTHQLYFPDEELKSLFLLAINFCIRKFNEGDLHFAKEGFTLYKQGFESGVLLENGRLSRFAFNNFIGFGIRLGAFDRVNHFLKDYGKALESEQRESTLHFNRARLAYAQKDYHQAMLLLQNSDFKDLVNNLITKTILLKIYYELGEFDSLESHLTSMEAFIRRHKLSDYHRKNYRNIILVTRKLLNLPPGDRQERKLVKESIEGLQPLSERDWFLALLSK